MLNSNPTKRSDPSSFYTFYIIVFPVVNEPVLASALDEGGLVPGVSTLNLIKINDKADNNKVKNKIRGIFKKLSTK